jgi:hypothetical protein
LTFSLPTVSKSGFKSTVTRMQWASDGKSLLYCNDKQEGIRILHVQCQSVIPPCIQPPSCFLASGLTYSGPISRKYSYASPRNDNPRSPLRRHPNLLHPR